MKFLILIMSLVQELQLVQEKIALSNYKCETKDEFTFLQPSDNWSCAEPTIFIQKFANLFSSLQVLEVNCTYLKGFPLGVCIFEHFILFITSENFISCSKRSQRFSFYGAKPTNFYMDILVGYQVELVSFATMSCSIFWSNVKLDEAILPGSVKGKLGGPSQRRLPSSIATLVLLAVRSSMLFSSLTL